MISTLGIVQVSAETSQIKSGFRRKLGGQSLLEWVVRRVTDCQRLDGVIALIDEQQTHIAQLVPPDVPVFVGSQNDMLKRYAAALDEYPAEAVVRVRLDSPFVDPALIDRLVSTSETIPGSDYIGYCSRDGRPAILSPVGMFAEWFRVASLRKANRRASDPLDRQQVTRYLYSHPETFNIRLIPIPDRLDREDLRLTLDVEEDWEHVETIFDALPLDRMDWQAVASLLDQQPAMRQRMAVLNRAAHGD